MEAGSIRSTVGRTPGCLAPKPRPRQAPCSAPLQAVIFPPRQQLQDKKGLLPLLLLAWPISRRGKIQRNDN